MARRHKKEYIPVRYDPGTLARVDALKDYVGAEQLRKTKNAADVDRSEVMRDLLNFALEVYERRADVWRAEESVV